MRVIINYDLCESNALCMAAAPEVFEVRDDDFLYLLQENPSEELRGKVLTAASILSEGSHKPSKTRDALHVAPWAK